MYTYYIPDRKLEKDLLQGLQNIDKIVETAIRKLDYLKYHDLVWPYYLAA